MFRRVLSGIKEPCILVEGKLSNVRCDSAFSRVSIVPIGEDQSRRT